MIARILVACRHPGGANALVPVVRGLIAPGIEVVVIGHGFSGPVFDKAGIYYKTIEDFGLSDISVSSARWLLGIILPDLVLVGTAPTSKEPMVSDVIDQTLIVAARELGIKSLAVLDYWTRYSERFSNLQSGENLIYLPDYIAIMDKIAEREMLAEGFLKEKLVITGNPYFDSLPVKAKGFTESRKQEIRKQIGLSCQTLFYFGGSVFSMEKPVMGYWDLDIIELIARVIPNFPGLGVAVRLHPRMPSGDKKQIEEAIAGSGAKIKLIEDISSEDLTLATDLTIVSYSTLGMEAVYMRKPCVSFQPGLAKEDMGFASRSRIIPVSFTAEGCEDLLRQCLFQGYREQLLEDSADFATDGKATERVISLALSIVHE
jgi:hypothetical protein